MELAVWYDVMHEVVRSDLPLILQQIELFCLYYFLEGVCGLKYFHVVLSCC